MAHAARIDGNGIVRQVVVVDDDNFTDAKGKTFKGKVGTFPQDELLMKYMESIGLGVEHPGEWLFTSYDAEYRGVFAGLGYTYDHRLIEFRPPHPPETQTEEES